MEEPAEAASTISMRLFRAIEIVLKYSGSPPIRGRKIRPTKAGFQCRRAVTGSIAPTSISERMATPAVATVSRIMLRQSEGLLCDALVAEAVSAFAVVVDVCCASPAGSEGGSDAWVVEEWAVSCSRIALTVWSIV